MPSSNRRSRPLHVFLGLLGLAACGTLDPGPDNFVLDLRGRAVSGLGWRAGLNDSGFLPQGPCLSSGPSLPLSSKPADGNPNPAAPRPLSPSRKLVASSSKPIGQAAPTPANSGPARAFAPHAAGQPSQPEMHFYYELPALASTAPRAVGVGRFTPAVPQPARIAGRSSAGQGPGPNSSSGFGQASASGFTGYPGCDVLLEKADYETAAGRFHSGAYWSGAAASPEAVISPGIWQGRSDSVSLAEIPALLDYPDYMNLRGVYSLGTTLDATDPLTPLDDNGPAFSLLLNVGAEDLASLSQSNVLLQLELDALSPVEREEIAEATEQEYQTVLVQGRVLEQKAELAELEALRAAESIDAERAASRSAADSLDVSAVPVQPAQPGRPRSADEQPAKSSRQP